MVTLLTLGILPWFSLSAQTAGKSPNHPTPPVQSAAADDTELVALLGHPLPKNMVLAEWNKSTATRIVLRGYLTRAVSASETSGDVVRLLDDLKRNPKVARGDLTSVVHAGPSGKPEFEIVLTLYHPAYSALLLLVAPSPDVEVASKDAARGIVQLRNKKIGGLVTVDTKNYTAGSIGELVKKLVADKAAWKRPASSGAGAGTALESNGIKFPAFMPGYPGATTNKITTSKSKNVRFYDYYAQCHARPEAIVEFYLHKLTAAGFEVTVYREPDALGAARTAHPSSDVALTVKTNNGLVYISLTCALGE